MSVIVKLTNYEIKECRDSFNHEFSKGINIKETTSVKYCEMEMSNLNLIMRYAIGKTRITEEYRDICLTAIGIYIFTNHIFTNIYIYIYTLRKTTKLVT